MNDDARSFWTQLANAERPVLSMEPEAPTEDYLAQVRARYAAYTETRRREAERNAGRAAFSQPGNAEPSSRPSEGPRQPR